MRRISGLTSVLVAALMVLLSAAPASAEVWISRDGGDRNHRLDIKRVHVANGDIKPGRVILRTRVGNFRKGDVVVSNFANRRGYHVQVVQNLGGPRYVWRAKPGGSLMPDPCRGLRLRVNRVKDLYRVSVPLRCMARKTRAVSLNVLVYNNRNYSNNFGDQAPGRGYEDPMSRWIKRG